MLECMYVHMRRMEGQDDYITQQETEIELKLAMYTLPLPGKNAVRFLSHSPGELPG